MIVPPLGFNLHGGCGVAKLVLVGTTKPCRPGVAGAARDASAWRADVQDCSSSISRKSRVGKRTAFFLHNSLKAPRRAALS